MAEIHAHGDLIGREDECDLLRTLAAKVVSGEGGSAVVAGAPGSGKSALLHHFAESVRTDADLRSVPVLHVAGTPAERDWPYAGLHLLFSAAGALLSPDDGMSATALAQAVVDQAGAGASAYDVARQVLELVERTAPPMLVIVDDAHLLDRASREVLGFVARRLRAVPVVLVVATGSSVEDATPFAGLRTLHLADLNRSQAAELVRRAADGRITDSAVEHIVANTGGNPRALQDVTARVPVDQREGRTALDRYLPQSDVLQELFVPELETFDERRRHALLVAASNEDDQLAPVATALADEPDRPVAWLAQHYLTVSGGSFRFRAPAVRSVVWRAASLEERANASLVLADAYADADPAQRLWHRAMAAQGYDDALASELQQAADEAHVRGEPDRSVAFAKQAARLASDNTDRVERLILSGRLALHAGRLGEVVRAAGERFGVETSLEQRADLAYLEAHARNLDDGQVVAGLIVRHAEEVSATDSNRAARLYLLAARQFADRMEFQESSRLVTAAERHLVNPDAATASLHRCIEAVLASVNGESDRAVVLADAEPVPNAGGLDAAEIALRRADALVRAERYDPARAVLHELTRDPRFTSSPVLMGSAHGELASLELRAGRIVAAREAAAAAEQAMPHPWCRSGRLAANLIRVHALLGEPDKAWTQHHRAVEHAQRTGEWAAAALLQAGTGLLLMLLNRPDEAVPVLDRARRYALEHTDPSLLLTEPDLIEACVRQGDMDRAQDALQEFEARVRKAPTAWAHATFARCRALVAEGAEAVPLFHQAVDACAEPVSPLELARTQLCFAERLRRLGRSVECRKWLERAIVQFREAGALAFVARAERELPGRSRGAGRGTARDEILTAAEHKVAAMAATGMRNREIAAELYVSSRTVEGQLTQVFRKLGIRSRTELAGVLGNRALHGHEVN